MLISYVTGCSGTGKTTLHDLLTADPLDGATVVELDSSTPGPRAAEVEWLEWRAAEYLVDATDKTEAGVRPGDDGGHLIVTGIVWPFRLVGSNAWRPAMKAGVEVQFLLLDRPWPDVSATLSARIAHWDDPEEIAEQIDNNRRLQRGLRSQVEALEAGFVIDDGDLRDARRHLNVSTL